ncbi:hypothetical protein BH11ARM1_BH11ARM1_13220 [soil metagenome]
MANKTIRVEIDVFEQLQKMKSHPRESISQVIRRTLPRPGQKTGHDLLRDIEQGKKPFGLSPADTLGYE